MADPKQEVEDQKKRITDQLAQAKSNLDNLKLADWETIRQNEAIQQRHAALVQKITQTEEQIAALEAELSNV